MDEIFDRLAAEIRAARRHSNLTQEQLAQYLNVSVESISHFENGRRRPSLETMAAMTATIPVNFGRVFGIPVSTVPSTKKRTALAAELGVITADMSEEQLGSMIAIATEVKQLCQK